MTQSELYYGLPAAVTKNTFTTQAVISAPGANSVPRCLIPALYFSTVGKSVQVTAWGTIANTAAATFVFAAGLDTTAGTIANTLFTTSALTPTAATTCVWHMDFDIVAQAVGNNGTTLQVNGLISVSAAASSGAWSAGFQSEMVANNITGVNNEAALYMELFGTWSASSASNTTTLQQFKVYLEN